MNKAQFWILNCVGGVSAVLIIASLILSRTNEQNSQTLMGRQTEFNRAQQVQTTMQNLVVRIAQAGRTDGSLSNLLVRHDLKVNFNQETPAKPAP